LRFALNKAEPVLSDDEYTVSLVFRASALPLVYEMVEAAKNYPRVARGG
jgi:hypothetical protein